MQKPIQLILIALLAIVMINLFVSISGKSHIRDVIKNLEQSQHNIDAAINEIHASRNRLDSIQVDLTKFKYYIKDIQQTVTLMEVERNIKECRDRLVLDSLQLKRAWIQQGLAVNDSLPPIIVKRL